MRVHTLHPKGLDNTHIAALSDVILGVGRPSFAGNLFTLARQVAGAHHVTGFCVTGRDSIRTVLTENEGDRPIARSVAERYVRHHWKYDPVQQMLSQGTASVQPVDRCLVVGIDASDVEHADYRDDCYSSINLGHRLSIVRARDEGVTMRVNFYRKRGRDFSQDEINRITDIADLIIAVVWRHDDQGQLPTDPVGREQLFLRRLACLAPALTQRERQVCALSALGLTSEGIALTLDITINTVLTYRKRAYKRLAISSANELMLRLLS